MSSFISCIASVGVSPQPPPWAIDPTSSPFQKKESVFVISKVRHGSGSRASVGVVDVACTSAHIEAQRI